MNNRKKIECQNFNEYTLMLRMAKMKLHTIYIAIICVVVCVTLIVASTAENAEFVSKLSFSGTITSIILSVIAIILSITGESKTTLLRAQMEDTALKLENTADKIDKIGTATTTNMKILESSLKKLEDKIQALPENIAAETERQIQMGIKKLTDSKSVKGRWKDSEK